MGGVAGLLLTSRMNSDAEAAAICGVCAMQWVLGNWHFQSALRFAGWASALEFGTDLVVACIQRVLLGGRSFVTVQLPIAFEITMARAFSLLYFLTLFAFLFMMK